MFNKLLLVSAAAFLLLLSGCAFTSVVNENSYAKVEKAISIELIHWNNAKPKAYSVSMLVQSRQPIPADYRIPIQSQLQALKELQQLSNDFILQLQAKFAGFQSGTSAQGEGGIVLRLQPTKLHRTINTGRRIEIEATVTANGTVVWQSTLAAFGNDQQTNKELADAFIEKLIDELKKGSISLVKK